MNQFEIKDKCIEFEVWPQGSSFVFFTWLTYICTDMYRYTDIDICYIYEHESSMLQQCHKKPKPRSFVHEFSNYFNTYNTKPRKKNKS